MFKKLMNRPPKAPTPNKAPPSGGGDEKRPPSPAKAEKSPYESPSTYEAAKPLFWQHLEANDSQGVTAALAGLERKDRKRIVHEPKVLEAAEASAPANTLGYLPKKPLCVAAAGGALSVLQAVLSGGAHPLVGDPHKDGTALTALFWAAAYGRRTCMDFLCDVEGLPEAQVLRAAEGEPTATTVGWLRNRNFEGPAFREAIRQSVLRDNAEHVKHLVEWGNVSPNSLMHQEGAGNADDDYQPLLCYAIERNLVDAAKALVDLHANPDGKVPNLEKGPKFEKTPLSLAMNHYALNTPFVVGRPPKQHGPEAFLDLVTKLLRAGASAEYKHLKEALHYKSTNMVVTLLRDGNVAPSTVADANQFIGLAETANLPRVVAIALDLRTLLQHGVTWKDSASKEGDSPLVARARERILDLCEADDDDMAWMPSGASVLKTSTDLVAKKGKASAVTGQLANMMGLGRRDHAAEAEAASQGALVTVKKKRFLGH